MTKAAAVMVCGGEKELFLRFFNFDSWRGGRLSGQPFCSRRIPRVGFLFEQSYVCVKGGVELAKFWQGAATVSAS